MDITFGTSLLQKVKRGDPLSGDEVFNLRRTITTYYTINQKILDFAKEYKPVLSEVPKDFASEVPSFKQLKHILFV